MGFNGIPVALLATSNPVGIIFSSLFVSYIQVGGEAMQPEFAKEVIDIIISVIIYLAAFSLLLKGLINRLLTWQNTKHDKLSAAGSASVGDGQQNPQVGAATANKSESEGVTK